MLRMPAIALTLSASVVLAACGGSETPTEAPVDEAVTVGTATGDAPHSDAMADDAMAPRTLAEVVADATVRNEAEMARDKYRHPVETLEFFGLAGDMTVVEISPGGGWYSRILAPYLAANGGTFYAAGYDLAAEGRAGERARAYRDAFAAPTFGEVRIVPFGADSGPMVAEGTADMVLTFRNVHNFAMNDFADKAFADFYAALKPGGVLGVVEHRLPEDADTAMEDSSGYMKESTVIALAEGAGFVLQDRSEVNANPADDADHPFGVWTLPPVSRTTGSDGNAPEGFDAEAYRAIGESDRMTLKFRKPDTPDAALLE